MLTEGWEWGARTVHLISFYEKTLSLLVSCLSLLHCYLMFTSHWIFPLFLFSIIEHVSITFKFVHRLYNLIQCCMRWFFWICLAKNTFLNINFSIELKIKHQNDKRSKLLIFYSIFQVLEINPMASCATNWNFKFFIRKSYSPSSPWLWKFLNKFLWLRCFQRNYSLSD